MKKHIYLALLLCLFFSVTASAQKISKPTLTPTIATASQKQLINDGIKLHDLKQYDKAIEKYEEVLKENPSSDKALYEFVIEKN